MQVNYLTLLNDILQFKITGTKTNFYLFTLNFHPKHLMEARTDKQNMQHRHEFSSFHNTIALFHRYHYAKHLNNSAILKLRVNLWLVSSQP